MADFQLRENPSKDLGSKGRTSKNLSSKDLRGEGHTSKDLGSKGHISSDTLATGLTEEGREVLERALPAVRQEIEERFAKDLNEEEIRTIRRAMRKVIRSSGEEPLSDEPGDA